MTMFNSQKINTDPKAPWVVAGYARKNGRAVTWKGDARDEDHAIEQFDSAHPNCDPHTYGQIPRREFDNRPNPVLVAFREAGEHSVTGRTVPERALFWLDEMKDGFLEAMNPEAVKHARKVLTRLAAA